MTQYGGSFAQKLIDLGQYEEAVAAADQAIARDRDDPEPLVDRATALTALERFAEAVRDLEEAVRLDEEAQVLETEFVDDALFAALLGEARGIAAGDPTAAVARLRHYGSCFPAGRHLGDVERCSRQLRGERDEAPIVKEREASGMPVRAVLLLLLVGAAACPATVEGGPDLAQTPLRCVPGEVRSCTCLGGGVGGQHCQSDGRRYAACAGCPTGSSDADQGEVPPPLIVDGFEPGGSPCGDCDGCCNDAACVPFSTQSKDACGKKGDTCAGCAAGEVCLQGTCVVDTGTCSALSCGDGCCSANVCARPDKQSWALCGSGGQTCQSCAYGVECRGGCTDDIDPAATAFFIRVKYVSVTQESWDYLSGPDLLVCFGQGTKIGCARPCGDDGYACTPPAASGRIVDAMGQNVAFTGAQLRAGLPIAVWDEDYPDAHDLVGNGTLPITKRQAAYSTGQFVSVTQLTFEIY